MSLQSQIIEKGIIQPSFGRIKRIKNLITRVNIIHAGVLTSEGLTVGLSETQIYEREIVRPMGINLREKEIKYLDEDVIYFCIPQNHFGHVLTGTLASAHILLSDDYKNHKIVFIDEEPCKAIVTLLGHLGVKNENILTIKEYTQFKSVVVLELSFRCVSLPRFRKRKFELDQEYVDTFQAIAQKFKGEQSPNKVYFSRSKMGKQSVMGEDIIEAVFRENGYEIFYPETLPLDTQIKLVANADSYVCVQGTLEHHSLFMKDEATLIVLQREKNPTERQVLINKLQKSIKHQYIQTNVRPIGEKGSRYIIGVTKELLDFFNKNNFVYDVEKLMPTYEQLLAYLHFNLSCNYPRSVNIARKSLQKLLLHHKKYWKQIK